MSWRDRRKDCLQTVVILALLFFLILISLLSGGQLQRMSGTFGVRDISNGVTGEQIQKRCQDMEETKSAFIEIPQIAGWGLEKDTAVSVSGIGRLEVETQLYRIWGDARLALYGELSEGSYPYPEDIHGCLVSEGLAEELFGTTHQLTGCKVTIGEEEYTIRGVLKGDALIMAIQTDGRVPLQNLELRYSSEKYPASRVTEFLNIIQAYPYEGFLDGSLYGGIAGIFMWLPVLILLVSLWLWLWQILPDFGNPKIRIGKSGLLVLLLVGIFLLILPGLFSFSEDYLPSRISDLDFWVKKWESSVEQYRSSLLYQQNLQENSVLKYFKICTIFGSAAILVEGCSLGLILKRQNFRKRLSGEKIEEKF